MAVAKLDRLSRDVHFISGLRVHRVAFLVAELGPDVDPSCSRMVKKFICGAPPVHAASRW
jgi:hypothetical protein